jgi:hypothetical protein
MPTFGVMAEQIGMLSTLVNRLVVKGYPRFSGVRLQMHR